MTVVDSPNEEAYGKIGGWCSSQKRHALQAIIHTMQPELCVEVGVFCGSSLVPQAVALKQNGHGIITGIDPWCASNAIEGMKDEKGVKWWTDLPFSQVMADCEKAIKDFGVEAYVRLLRMTGDEAAGQFQEQSIGLLHIDGAHGAEPAMRDGVNYLPKVKVGGIICCDDESWSENGELTVRPMIDYLIANGCRYLTCVTGAAVLRKER